MIFFELHYKRCYHSSLALNILMAIHKLVFMVYEWMSKYKQRASGVVFHCKYGATCECKRT